MVSFSQTLGAIFPEGIIKAKKKRSILKNLDKKEDSSSFGRMLFFVLLLVFGLGAIFARFFTIVAIEGERYQKLSSDNRIKEIKITAPRGIIYDRHQTPLVRNIPIFVSKDNKRFFEEKPASISETLKEEVGRDYVFGDLFAHIIGYVGEIGEEELRNSNYQPGDIIGKSGIEKEYDQILRGIDGKELIEVDALGQTVRTLGRLPSSAGKKINLTIDLELQKFAKEVLGNKTGAVIIENPLDGSVLALYSSPSFDPNKLIRGENTISIFNDEKQPLFNRAVSGQYPPGSTFKIISALAALETGAITKETRFEDTGILTVGQFSFGNWYFSQYGKKEGILDIVGAIKRSNDIFFYKLGEAIGITKLSTWVKNAGLVGIPTGIDLPGEAVGLMPDPLWQRENKGEDWYLGNTYHIAIGQGDLLATPLQVNSWTNVIANNGKICQPHLKALDKKELVCKDLGIKKENIALVKEGMRQACAKGGTASIFSDFTVESESLKVDEIDFLNAPESTLSAKKRVGIPVACKTGTAEFGSANGKTHAWFTVFAPFVHPQVSVTVLVEGGGEGSAVAAPIAKKILEKWFTM